jgi:hypothetical protein
MITVCLIISAVAAAVAVVALGRFAMFVLDFLEGITATLGLCAGHCKSTVRCETMHCQLGYTPLRYDDKVICWEKTDWQRMRTYRACHFTAIAASTASFRSGLHPANSPSHVSIIKLSYPQIAAGLPEWQKKLGVVAVYINLHQHPTIEFPDSRI